MKVAVFDLTCCEGCELQILNCEEELLDLTSAIEFVEFREAMSETDDHYDIAFIDGSCSQESEVTRLHQIREKSTMVIPIGSCACIGGINSLKNMYSMPELLKTDYGSLSDSFNSIPAVPVKSVIPIDYYIPGCPIVRKEFIRVVQELLAGRVPYQPSDPVCAECKLATNICVFERGVTCLGPVTRGGCEATCVTNGAVCWGCRGLIDEPNIYAEKLILEKANLSIDDIVAKLNLFNTGQEDLWQ